MKKKMNDMRIKEPVEALPSRLCRGARSVWFQLLAGLGLLISAGIVSAQEATDDAPVDVEPMTIERIFEMGGWPMYVLLGMSLLGLAFVLYFFVVVRQGQITPGNFLYDLRKMLEQGNLEKSREACET